MRKALIIAKREYLTTVRSKGFLLGLILVPILMSSGLIGVWVAEKKKDVVDKRIAIVDRSELFQEVLTKAAQRRNEKDVVNPKTGKKVQPAYLLEFVPPAAGDANPQRLELSSRIRQKQLHAFLEIGGGILTKRDGEAKSTIRYYAESTPFDEGRRWLEQEINEHLRHLRVTKAGIPEDAARDLFIWVGTEAMDLVSKDKATGQIKPAVKTNEAKTVGVPMVMEIMMFMLILMGASPLLQSVMEEKNQRIAEVVISCVDPFLFMAGKLLGGIGVSMTASAVYFGAGIASVLSMGFADFLPVKVLPWFVIFLVLSVVTNGAIFATLGSLAGDPKQAQSLTMPAMLPMMIPMFLIVPLMQQPHSPLAVTLSLIPPVSPMVMILRQCTSAGVPLWQLLVSLTGMIGLAVFSVWVGGRVFRFSLLTQGKLPSFSEILRWGFRS